MTGKNSLSADKTFLPPDKRVLSTGEGMGRMLFFRPKCRRETFSCEQMVGEEVQYKIVRHRPLISHKILPDDLTRRLFNDRRYAVVKRFFAILSAALLVWMQFSTAQATAACARPAMSCSDACRQMPCCAAKPVSGSQSVPAVPTQSNAQNQILFPAPSLVIWNLPQSPASLISFVSAPPPVMAAPLYARNCSLLL
jgi:hypothetical protein